MHNQLPHRRRLLCRLWVSRAEVERLLQADKRQLRFSHVQLHSSRGGGLYTESEALWGHVVGGVREG